MRDADELQLGALLSLRGGSTPRLSVGVGRMRPRGRRRTVTTPVESPDLEELGRALRVDPRLRSQLPEVPQVRDPDDSGPPQPLPKPLRPQLNSVELFAGAGGLALGCQKAGFSSLATLEWDRWACDTIRENKAAGHALVQDWNVTQGDVRDFDWSQIDEDVDLVSGGPPCQPFSAGGHGRSVDDERDMFPATAEVLSQLRPKAFLIENVRGLTRSAFADYYEYVLRRMERPELTAKPREAWFDHLKRLRKATSVDTLRYDVFPTLLDAADFGVPQQRHRVIMGGVPIRPGREVAVPGRDALAGSAPQGAVDHRHLLGGAQGGQGEAA